MGEIETAGGFNTFSMDGDPPKSPLYPHDILLLLNDCLLYMIVVTNTISTLYHMVIYEQSSSNKNLNYIYIG